MKNVAIASYSFHGLYNSKMIDVFSYLESVKFRYNMDTADIWNGMIPTLDDDFTDKIKIALQQRDLTLVNLCVDGPHLWEDNIETRKNNHENALKYLKLAEKLNAKTIRIDVGVQGKEMNEEQFEYVAKTYKEYAKIADSCGFKVGPENHWGASLNIKVMERLNAMVDSKAYGILLHYKPWEGDDNGTGNEVSAKFAMHTHLDATTCKGDIEPVIKMLIEKGYNGAFCVEHHTGKNEYNEVLGQLGVVKAALGRLQDQGITAGGFNPILRKSGLE